jgi:hypothetical protein
MLFANNADFIEQLTASFNSIFASFFLPFNTFYILIVGSFNFALSGAVCCSLFPNTFTITRVLVTHIIIYYRTFLLFTTCAARSIWRSRETLCVNITHHAQKRATRAERERGCGAVLRADNGKNHNTKKNRGVKDA